VCGLQHDAPVKTVHWIKGSSYSCLMTGSWDKTLKVSALCLSPVFIPHCSVIDGLIVLLQFLNFLWMVCFGLVSVS